MIAKFTFNYNGGFEKKENAVFQQGSIGVDSYQVFAPFLTTTQVYIKTKRNGDLEFSLWKQLDYNSTIGGWLKTATQDELLVDGEMKVVFKFNNLVSQETSLWVRKGTLIVPEMTTYEALRDYVENQEQRIDHIIDGTTDIAFNNTGTDLDAEFVDDAIKEINDKANANEQNIADLKDGTDAFSEITLGTPPNVVTIRYIHTNGNNFQVVGILYPDGREANINEEMYVNFRNKSGATRDSGIFLMTDGLSTGNQAVKGVLFNPTSQHARKFLGVVTVDGVGVNQKSKATHFGIVHGIPTTRFRNDVGQPTYEEGQYLWATADGLLSNQPPAKPALQINVGVIINLQGGNADILVCPIVYGAFGDSSDVIITSPTNGDIPILGSDGIWRNSQRLVTVEGKVTTLETKTTNLETANMIKSYTYNPSTHVLTFTYYDNTTTSFDLPLESAIVDASYDNVTKDITFTLQSGATLVVPLDDIISGLASETWVTNNFIPKTALKTSFSATPLDTNVISEKLAKDTFDEVEARVDTLETFKNTAENTLQTLKEKDSEIELKVTTIEEAYRKSQNGELTATKYDTDNISLGKDVAPAPLQVKVEGGLLDAPQLVSNGDFSNGTTNFISFDSTLTNTSNFLIITGNGTNSVVGVNQSTNISVNNGHLIYMTVKATSKNALITSIYLRISGSSGGSINGSGSGIINNPVLDTQYHLSELFSISAFSGNYVFSLRHALSSNNSYVAHFDDFYAFNISTLISNKQYSPIYDTTFDLMNNTQIKAQMDLWVQNGTLPNDNVLAVGMNKRVRSVGKNLFNKTSITPNTWVNLSGAISSSSFGNATTDFIPVQEGLRYRSSGNTTQTGVTGANIIYYDVNKNKVSDKLNDNANWDFTVPTSLGIKYIKTTVHINSIDTFQLELGSTATSYAPYANTDLYLQANKVGYKLPNGVADTVEYRNGKYYYVQRVKKYVLQASDLTGIETRTSYIQAYTKTKTEGLFTDGLTNVDIWQGSYRIPDWTESAFVTTGDYVANVFATVSNQRLYFNFSLGTTLAQAQTALAGTVIYYQLATPIETEILAFGNAQGLAGGTTYIDDIMADSNLYTSKYDIENTAYPIKSLDRIVKINADGSQTELAVSSATVAGDGLSFTHPSLVANDIVWIAYAYNVANLFKSNTFVTYYDNPFIAVQPNGTPRRITFSVDNSGVVTVSSVAV